MHRSLWFVLAAAACATPQKPDTSHVVVDSRSTPPPLEPSTQPTSTAEVHLQCRHLVPGYADFAVDLVADALDQCRVTHELSLKLENSTRPDDELTLHINPFEGPGEYVLDDPNLRALAIGAAIPGGTAAVQTPKYSCSGCKVTVTDANPAAPYPKSLGFVVSCPNLCVEDTHVCTPALNSNLSVPCTQ